MHRQGVSHLKLFYLYSHFETNLLHICQHWVLSVKYQPFNRPTTSMTLPIYLIRSITFPAFLLYININISITFFSFKRRSFILNIFLITQAIHVRRSKRPIIIKFKGNKNTLNDHAYTNHTFYLCVVCVYVCMCVLRQFISIRFVDVTEMSNESQIVLYYQINDDENIYFYRNVSDVDTDISFLHSLFL